jgi:hypothetical protein
MRPPCARPLQGFQCHSGRGEHLFAERFKDIKLPPLIQEAAAGTMLTSNNIIRLNRRMLEEAYPDAIVKSLGGVYPDTEIITPTPEDSRTASTNTIYDAQRRLQHDADFPNEPRQIKPGEDVHLDGPGVQVSGQVAVMSINGLLTKVIFDKNPTTNSTWRKASRWIGCIRIWSRSASSCRSTGIRSRNSRRR